jgi:hypothetical protein
MYGLALFCALFEKVEQLASHKTRRVYLLQCASLADNSFCTVWSFNALVSGTCPPLLHLLDLSIEYVILGGGLLFGR